MTSAQHEVARALSSRLRTLLLAALRGATAFPPPGHHFRLTRRVGRRHFLPLPVGTVSGGRPALRRSPPLLPPSLSLPWRPRVAGTPERAFLGVSCGGLKQPEAPPHAEKEVARDPRSPLRVTALAAAAAMAMRQTPLTCSGHTRPVVDLAFSGITPYGYFLISACKGEPSPRRPRLPSADGWVGRGCRLQPLRRWDGGVCSPLAGLSVSLFPTVVSSPQHCAFRHTLPHCVFRGFTGRRN